MPAFYIIRHAHKEKGDFYNSRLHHQDEPVSQQGQEEARKLWLYLCDKDISAIYVSRYLRTAQTIEHVAKQSGIQPFVDERLNEIDNRIRRSGKAFVTDRQISASQWEKLIRKLANALHPCSKKNNRFMPVKTLS